jgi:hypothetical protein
MCWEFIFMLHEFSYAEYRRLLELATARNRNLRFRDLPADGGTSRYFILRHDVDFSPAAALRMAEFESALGVRATYFLLFSSSFYNLFSEEYCRVPRLLTALGHEVGLHYDLACYDVISRDRPLEILVNQADTLSQLCGETVRSIAMHNPSVYGADVFQHVERFINAYDPSYTREIAYFSDSCGAWRDEAAVVFQRGEMPPRFQLLIHPIFWDQQPGDRWARMNGLVEKQGETLLKSAADVRLLWTQHAGVKQHEARTRIAHGAQGLPA